jgi:hypothetical protein
MSNYPVNFLRNVSRKYSLTKYILLIDADFYVPKDLRNRFENGKLDVIMNNLDNFNHKVVIVIPSYWNDDRNLSYPNNKLGKIIFL